MTPQAPDVPSEKFVAQGPSEAREGDLEGSPLMWLVSRAKFDNEFRARDTSVGMTLVELMIVVVIIAILAGIAVPLYGGYRRRSRATEASSNVQLIATAQEAYRREKGRYANVNLDNPATPACTDGGCASQWDNWGCAAASVWCQLGWQPEKQSVYFVYNTWAGTAGPATPGWAAPLVANPELGWYSIEARGDLRNDDGKVTKYRMTSTGTQLINIDEFE